MQATADLASQTIQTAAAISEELGFVVPGAPRLMLLGRALSLTAERHPERVAIAGERPLTYAEWDRRTNRLARGSGRAGRRARGPRRGRRRQRRARGERPPRLPEARGRHGPAQRPLQPRRAGLLHRRRGSKGARVRREHGGARRRRARPARRGRSRRGSCTPRHELEALIGEQPDGALDVAVGRGGRKRDAVHGGHDRAPQGRARAASMPRCSPALAHVTQARYSPAGESTLCAMPMYHTMGLRSLVSMVLIGGTTAFLPSFSAGGSAHHDRARAAERAVPGADGLLGAAPGSRRRRRAAPACASWPMPARR